MGKQSRRRRDFSGCPLNHTSFPYDANEAYYGQQFDDGDFEFTEPRVENPRDNPEERPKDPWDFLKKRQTSPNVGSFFKLAGSLFGSYVHAVRSQYTAQGNRPSASLFDEPEEKKKNPFDVIGIPRGSSIGVVKTQFRKLALLYHPDRQIGNSEETKRDAEVKMKEINEAYQQICADIGNSKEQLPPKRDESESNVFSEDPFPSKNPSKKKRAKAREKGKRTDDKAEQSEQEIHEDEMTKRLKKQAEEELATFKAEIEKITRKPNVMQEGSSTSSVEPGASGEPLSDVFENSTSSLAVAIRLNLLTVLISLVSRGDVAIDLALDEHGNNALHYCVYYDRAMLGQAILSIMSTQWAVLVCSKNQSGRYPSDIIPKVQAAPAPVYPDEPTTERLNDEVPRPAPVGFLAQRLRDLEKCHVKQEVEYEWCKILIDIIGTVLLFGAMKTSEVMWGTHFYDSKRIIVVGILFSLPLFRQLPFLGICAVVSFIALMFSLSWVSLFCLVVPIATYLTAVRCGGKSIRNFTETAALIALTAVYACVKALQYPYEFIDEHFIKPIMEEFEFKEMVEILEHEKIGNAWISKATHFLKLYVLQFLVSGPFDSFANALISWNIWLAVVWLKRLAI
jgi:hypothetical protein